MPKKELALLRMFPCLGDVYWNPATVFRIEVGPAVVAGNVGCVLVCGDRKTDLEARWNILRARHRNKERVEIRAVSLLGVTCVEGVAVPPSGAALVVAHVGEYVLIDRATFVVITAFHVDNLLDRELGRKSCNRNQLVRGKKTLLLRRAQSSRAALSALPTDNVIDDLEVIRVLFGFRSFCVQCFVAIFALASLSQRKVAGLRDDAHGLEVPGAR